MTEICDVCGRDGCTTRNSAVITRLMDENTLRCKDCLRRYGDYQKVVAK
jgi:hypothetical protein